MQTAFGFSQEEKDPVDVACEELCPTMTAQQRTIGYVITFSGATTWIVVLLIDCHFNDQLNAGF